MANDWFDRVPKVELHLHLEGAIPHETLWALVQKYGGDPDLPDMAALEERFRYRDFPHFVETWIWQAGFIREHEDFALIAEAVARDLAGQNVRYAEAFFSAPDFARHGLTTQGIATAIRSGLDQIPEIEVALIADLVRDRGPDAAATTLAEVAEVRDRGVIGIGIGGSEQAFPPEPFAPVYVRARRLGFHATAHAGEAAGAESVWGAIRTLQVERIGHGTRAHEDVALVAYLAEARIPLEMCPVSNVRTGVVASIEEHPIKAYADEGLLVTVGTDDPAMFGTSLAYEYRLLVERLGFTRDGIRELILNAIDASWLPDERQAALRVALELDPGWNDGEA